jgi:hypothetical protein
MGLLRDLRIGLFSSKSGRDERDNRDGGWRSDRVDPHEREAHKRWLHERSQDP